ncbi:histidine phosphatase family protein [candidate division TA06 bacterium]|nr:histidine phosphatase family protein [candidate division TA06 bacterium]
MKTIEVRRHTQAEKWEDLTDEGRYIVGEVVKRMEKDYDIIISSPKKRAQQTLLALGYKIFEIDKTFGTLSGEDLTYYEQKVQKVMKDEALTLLEAYLKIPETQKILMNHGWKFTEGLRRIAARLPKNGKALIVSHGGSIEPAILTILGGESLDAMGGELGYCEGARFIFNEKDILKKVEVLRL